ncbi:MAG TPA: transglycosylase SLT domain-containing protein [Gemmatimonadales bacterium]|nr:transglycosylase SLT domain-containing protein [Gemmatimonadales bacterium]
MAQAGKVLLSGMDVAKAAYEANFRGDALTTAVAVAKAESQWYRDVISASEDYGLWQINRPAHPGYDFTRLLADPLYNAQAAYTISGQGKNWNPWYTYTPLGQPQGSGPWRSYINESIAAVNSFLGFSGFSGNVGTPSAAMGPFLPGVSSSDTATQSDVSQWQPASIVRGTAYKQQAFDERIRRTGLRSGPAGIFGGPTHTGWIEPIDPDRSGPATTGSKYIYNGTIKMTGAGGYQDISANSEYAVYFLFNPNEINISYAANPQILPIAALDQTQVNPNLPMSDPNNTVSFSLYFDRTYEVMGGSQLGIYSDIRQLEQLTGITPQQPVMKSYPVKIFFGKPADFHINALIQSMNVSYVHFSHDMIPMRGTVDIVAQRLSSINPFASEDTTKFYSGDDWQKKVIEGKDLPDVTSMGPSK